MVSTKLLLSIFVVLNFFEVFAANVNPQASGIVFETEDTNKNRTATHVSKVHKQLTKHKRYS